ALTPRVVLCCAKPRSDAAVPGVALVAPVAAALFGQEQNARQVLGVLVAELDRRVDARRRAEGGLQQPAVLAVDDQCLRVQRAVEIPALVIRVVEGLEIDVARLREQAGPARQLGEWHARADRDGRPPLDAEVLEAQLGPREGHQLAQRELGRALDQPAYLEAPGPARALVPDGQVGGDEVRGEARARQGGAGGRDVHRPVTKKGALDLFVPALRRSEKPLSAFGPLGVAARERQGRERAGAEPRLQEGSAIDVEPFGGVSRQPELAHDSLGGSETGGAGGFGPEGGASAADSAAATGDDASTPGRARKFTNGRALRSSGERASL